MSMKISGKRMRRAGGAGAESWVARMGVGAMVAGAAWAGWNGVRPIAGGGEGSALAPDAVSRLEFAASDVAARGELLARAGTGNMFAADRIPWTSRRPVGPGTDTNGDGNEEIVTPRTKEPEPTTKVGVIQITPEGKLSSDVKKAREELFLRGIRSTLDGSIAAMIAMNSYENAKYAKVFRVGDEFVDSKYAKAKWRVEAVDAAQKVVVLSRSGETVALPLYDQSDDARARLVASGVRVGQSQTSATMVPRVERQSVEEIAAALRAAGVSDAEIAGLLARMRSDEVLSAPVKAGTEGGAPEGLDVTPALTAPASGAPEGIDDIFKILFSGGAPPMDTNLPTFDEDEDEDGGKPEPEPE
ncbi:MAG: hypothetical protein KDA30_13200 [Phycisphaerales bacterium]|nr:hypothetical protein [Phycisphaerales bacterium]